jgi:hypothetical protein
MNNKYHFLLERLIKMLNECSDRKVKLIYSIEVAYYENNEPIQTYIINKSSDLNPFKAKKFDAKSRAVTTVVFSTHYFSKANFTLASLAHNLCSLLLSSFQQVFSDQMKTAPFVLNFVNEGVVYKPFVASKKQKDNSELLRRISTKHYAD